MSQSSFIFLRKYITFEKNLEIFSGSYHWVSNKELMREFVDVYYVKIERVWILLEISIALQTNPNKF